MEVRIRLNFSDSDYNIFDIYDVRFNDLGLIFLTCYNSMGNKRLEGNNAVKFIEEKLKHCFNHDETVIWNNWRKKHYSNIN